MIDTNENLERWKEESALVSETSSSHSGDTSDRRDVEIATQVLLSRSEEYRLLFRLPPDEVLVQDFNCALQENLLLQGHMYVFIHHICFYSNIFGFETKKMIPFHEITCVRKAKTVAIFPNAIEIIAGERKCFFGSFLSRDEAYRLIVDGWAQHNSDVKALLDCQELKSDNIQDNGIVIVERVAESAQSADASSSTDRSKDVNGSEKGDSLLKGENNTEGSDPVSEYQENGKDEIADHQSLREPLTWKTEDLDAPKMPEYFTLITEAKFPVCVEEFFTLFISDRASNFLENFHQRCGDKDFQCTPWRQHEQSGHARGLSFLHPVKVYLGAKLGRCQEVQKYHIYRNSHLVIETSQYVSDVPFADYFHVEVLVQDFNCALQENLLLQGHMYVFIHHICFYSNIFGFETKKMIPFHEITCVRKAKTVAIFPNAIEIIAGERKCFFGSFLSRDEAYRLIVDGWAQHNSDVKALLDCQELKSDNIQDNGIVIVERVAESAQSADASSSTDRSKDVNGSEKGDSLLKGENNTEGSDPVSEYQENGKDEIADHQSLREPLTWKTEDLDAPKMPEYFTLITEAKFPVCVEEFFTLFISDRASNFLENFHQRCGDKDFQCTPWRQHEQSGHARGLSFLHPVKVYLGAKLGRCQEVQKYHIYRNSHLVIETSQYVSDVPFADYFHVERIWNVEKNDNEENSCILRVYCNVAFSKKTMFKGKIEQSTRDELREVHAIWINNAHELLKQKNLVKGVVGQNTGMIWDQEEGVGSSSKVENLHQKMTSVAPPIVPVEEIEPQTDNHVQENPGCRTLMASFFRASWATLLSYIKSQSHFPLHLAVAIVSILILMQISIVVLLTRVPQVHVVTQGNQITSASGYGSENTQWLEKRVDCLQEEMLMVETRMERMRQEHAVLKAHLQSLERLKPKS